MKLFHVHSGGDVPVRKSARLSTSSTDLERQDIVKLAEQIVAGLLDGLGEKQVYCGKCGRGFKDSKKRGMWNLNRHIRVSKCF